MITAPIHEIISIAEMAGKGIMTVYNRPGLFSVQEKADHSPLTEADVLSHDLICELLSKLTPNIPVLSEESTAISYKERKKWKKFWLVDPLDGTKEFIFRTGDFTVNIALIKDHVPIIGVVFVPLTEITYYATKGGGGYRKEKNSEIELKGGQTKSNLIRIFASRRHGKEKLEQFLANLNLPYELSSIGSSLKICFLAEGVGDLYPRFGQTSEWDTAAAHCILREAGGDIVDLQGRSLRYNQKESLLNPEFIAMADRQKNWLTYLIK